MTFELTIHGESPAELLAALQQLSITPQPQDTPAPQPEKQETARQQPEITRPEAPANSTVDEAAASASAAVAAPEPSTPAPTPDPVSLDKIRDLSRSLIVHGKRDKVQQIIKGTGAPSVTKLPPDRYTEVWEKLVALSGEVDEDAAG
jgi:hypothetical protein|nr:MAG TPA: hypothetical protein [Caudoviricetes sp.]